MLRAAKIRLAAAAVLVMAFGAAVVAEIMSLDGAQRAASVLAAVAGVALGIAILLALRWHHLRKQTNDQPERPSGDVGEPATEPAESWWSRIGFLVAMGSVPFWSLLPPPVLVGMLSMGWAFGATAVLAYGRGSVSGDAREGTGVTP